MSGTRTRRGFGGVVVGVCALVGCTAPNPRYMPRVVRGDGGALAIEPTPGCDGACTEGDLAAPVDAAAVDAAPAADGPPPPADAPPADAPPADVTAGADAAPGDAGTLYSFESALDGWRDQHYDYFGQPAAKVVRSTTRAYDGRYALEIALATGGLYRTEIGVKADFGARLPAGARITYHLWFPATGAIEGVQPYVFYYRAGATAPVFAGIDPILYSVSLNPGGWSTVTHRVPADADARGVTEVGLEWRTNGAQTLTVYLDAVGW